MKPLLSLLLATLVAPLGAGEIHDLGEITFQGDLLAEKNLSAVAVLDKGKYLVVGGDEGQSIQVLRRTGDSEYTVDHNIRLIDDDTKDEIDIEGMALRGDQLFVIGSHSRKRSQTDTTKYTRKENRKRLEENERERLRENLFSLKAGEEGQLKLEGYPLSVRDRLKEDDVLAPFLEIPSKENGIDIEGIAADGETLYVGFRGPVLREGFVPVLVFKSDEPDEAKTRYVQLGGRGIRDLVRVKGGFLVIGGPVRDEAVGFQVYFWNGDDCISGSDFPEPKLPVSLGQIKPEDEKWKPEGIAVLEESDTSYEVLVVFDGPKKGAPRRFRIDKPAAP